MSRFKVRMLKMIHRWIYPYPVMVSIKGLDRYFEIYEWLEAAVGHPSEKVWANLTQRTYAFDAVRINRTEMDGELRFKDAETAMLFKLTFHDEISG